MFLLNEQELMEQMLLSEYVLPQYELKNCAPLESTLKSTFDSFLKDQDKIYIKEKGYTICKDLDKKDFRGSTLRGILYTTLIAF